MYLSSEFVNVSNSKIKKPNKPISTRGRELSDIKYELDGIGSFGFYGSAISAVSLHNSVPSEREEPTKLRSVFDLSEGNNNSENEDISPTLSRTSLRISEDMDTID